MRGANHSPGGKQFDFLMRLPFIQFNRTATSCLPCCLFPVRRHVELEDNLIILELNGTDANHESIGAGEENLKGKTTYKFKIV